MTLAISPEAYQIRQNILRRVYDYKVQLIAAYQSKSPERIYTAKQGLIRYLYKLYTSPELGPPPDFIWPVALRVIITFNIDPNLHTSILSLRSYKQVAAELEKSLERNI